MESKGLIARLAQFNIPISIAGLFLLIIAIGSNQFVYTPTIPFLVDAQWLNSSQAGYIGTASFLGYFIGIYITHRTTHYLGAYRLVLLSLATSLLSLLCCAHNGGYLWLMFWRSISGLMAGFLAILAPAIVVAHTQENKRETATSIMFSGIGIGIFLTSLLVSPFHHWNGVTGIWTGLAGLTLAFSVLAFLRLRSMPNDNMLTHDASPFDIPATQKKVLCICLVAHSLFSISITPSMLFLSDYARHSLNANLNISSSIFSLFGIGCIVGSLLGGQLYKRFGAVNSILGLTMVGIVSCALVAFFHSLIFVSMNAFLSGFFLMAFLVAFFLFLGKIIGVNNHAKGWAIFTLTFAGWQFLSGFAYSKMLSLNIQYINLFRVGFCFGVLSLVCYLIALRKQT